MKFILRYVPLGCAVVGTLLSALCLWLSLSRQLPGNASGIFVLLQVLILGLLSGCIALTYRPSGFGQSMPTLLSVICLMGQLLAALRLFAGP